MLTDNPAAMDAYSSLYPGVDLLPTRLPRVDRYGHAWCIFCRCRNGGAVAGDGLCDECRASNRVAPHPARYGHGSAVWECSRCGQRHAVALAGAGQIPPNICEPCQQQDRKPQGEAVRLFEPAPNQIPGQLAL